MLVFITDKSRLERHFRLDPVLYAYCLGDLDEPWFSHCQWAGFYTATGNVAEDRHVQEVALIFNHHDGSTLQAFAQSELLREDIHLLAPLLTDTIHLHVNDTRLIEPLLSEFQVESEPTAMIKMSCTRRPQSIQDINDRQSGLKPVRLSSNDLSAARELYELALPDAFVSAEFLDASPCFGVKIEDHLVSIGGCHVLSKVQQVAVIGGVATHPELQNKGLARMVMHALLQEIPDDYLVCLNVAAENAAARHLYESLGFVKTHDYWEAGLLRKNSEQPS